MRTDKFCLDDETTDFKFSTIDHHENLDPSRGLQQDNINCGIWMLMEIFNRGDEYERPIGERTQQQLKAYRIRLSHLVIKIYELVAPDNNWLFEWEANKVLKMPSTWRKPLLNHSMMNFIIMPGGQR